MKNKIPHKQSSGGAKSSPSGAAPKAARPANTSRPAPSATTDRPSHKPAPQSATTRSKSARPPAGSGQPERKRGAAEALGAERPFAAKGRPYKSGGEQQPAKRTGTEPAKGGAPRPKTGLSKHPGEDAPKLRSGQTLELQIASTNNDGFGIAMHEGTRVLVAGGLPGERLVARVTYVGRREAFAHLLKCLTTSPDRNPAPACSMTRTCDGCALMQMRYPAQLAWKKGLVTRELRKYPSLAQAEISDTVASPAELGYRNTAKLVVSGKFTDPVIGIYRRNTHDVLAIEECPLHHPLINKVVKAAKAGIRKGKVPIYNPRSEMGLLRYLVVRVAERDGKVMVVLVTSEQAYNELHHLAKFIQQAVPEVTVVAQNINTSTGNVIFGQKERFVTKQQTLKAYLGEKSFNLSPHSFFQVNSGAARIIYEKVRELAALTGRERVLDVYCGIGGISLFLAEKAGEVVGIEVVEAAVADATENALQNGARNCRFEAGDAAQLIEEVGEEGGADLVVLNPPRKGCDEKVLKSVAALAPAKVIYVSCSPETLARDLDILSRLGYRTLTVQPVDMFPQTVHVEDVALLQKN